MCSAYGRQEQMRLDQALVARGLAHSRSRAGDLVRRGLVRVDGQVVTKAGHAVVAANRLEVDGQSARWVSRGAEKLLAALEVFGFEPNGRTALDIGASTGGFTEVLLDRGARRVYAVDVGHGQLHARLAGDRRVVMLEGVDARALASNLVPEPVGAIVVDVSFIAIAKVLPATLALAAPGAWLVALVKPQFEVGRARIGKGGIVRERDARERAVASARAWLDAQPGWSVVGDVASPLAGGDGNVEHLLGAIHVG